MATTDPLQELEPGILEIREGGGCVSLLGLPFLAAGLFLLLVVLGVVPLQNADEVPPWADGVFVVMGFAFTTVGGGIAFGRKWTRLDLNRGRVLKRWGLLLPMTTDESHLDEFDAVVLRTDRGDSDTSDEFPVSLRRRGNRGDLLLSAGTDFGRSRERAAALAHRLDLPLVDSTAGRTSSTDPALAHATLQERIRSGSERLDHSARPAHLRSTVREDRRGVEITIPADPFRASGLLGMAVPAGIFAWVAPGIFHFFRDTGTPQAVQIGAGLFLSIFLLGIPVLGTLNAWLRSNRGRTVISAGANGIHVEERGAWKATVRHIAAADILGLGAGTSAAALGSVIPRLQRLPGRESGWQRALRRVARSEGVIVKTRRGLVPLGVGLPDDEVVYLRDVIARALAGGRE